METFELYVDRKVMVWQRERHIIEADSLDEAVKTLTDALKDNPNNGSSELGSFEECKMLDETEEFLEPAANIGYSTLEIVDPENTSKSLWCNGKPQTTNE